MKKYKLLYTPQNPYSQASLLALHEQYYEDPNVDTRRAYEVWLDFRMSLLTEFEQNDTLTCVYCGRTGLSKITDGVEPKYQATLDHVYPLAKGGQRYDKSNLVVACRPCNAKKADNLL